MKNKGVIETPFRKEVLSVFFKNDKAIPLSVIENDLKSFNRITLYRTLKLFIEKGIVHEIKINGEVSNYAICETNCASDTHQHQHIHFKCNTCSEITCVELDEFPSVILTNYKVEELEIQAKGVCDKCSLA